MVSKLEIAPPNQINTCSQGVATSLSTALAFVSILVPQIYSGSYVSHRAISIDTSSDFYLLPADEKFYPHEASSTLTWQAVQYPNTWQAVQYPNTWQAAQKFGTCSLTRCHVRRRNSPHYLRHDLTTVFNRTLYIPQHSTFYALTNNFIDLPYIITEPTQSNFFIQSFFKSRFQKWTLNNGKRSKSQNDYFTLQTRKIKTNSTSVSSHIAHLYQ